MDKMVSDGGFWFDLCDFLGLRVVGCMTIAHEYSTFKVAFSEMFQDPLKSSIQF